MSHAPGAVKFSDGLILFFEYNGTSDVVIPKLRDSPEEVDKFWRTGDGFHEKCCCGNPPEDVEVACFYADQCWAGKACRHCKLIISPILMHYEDSLTECFDESHWMWSAFKASQT